MRIRAPRHLLAVVALPALMAAAAVGASAQSTIITQGPKVPRDSTKMNAAGSGGGSLVVDFDRPKEEAAAKPEDVAKPAAPGPAAPEVAAPICTTGDATVDSFIREAGASYGVDPCLVVAVMAQESGYRRYAVSPKGASGYMQLMPETARRFGVADIFDARQNIHAGTRYLRFLLDRFNGSLELALAGYNAGEGAVERYGRRIPPFQETQNYVRIISNRYMSRRAAKTTFKPTGDVVPPPAPVTAAAAAERTRPTVAWRMSVTFDSNE